MKAKLSALTLAVLPLFASATGAVAPTTHNASPSYNKDSVIVVYKKNAQKAEKAAAR